ncbi:MAG TPA: tetratricopeptide repeat protein, partial [Thermoanaerobaculia bacterium]|nr:tetratricopeptide repeat protein [Thermoanaerobaculia bacterium]
MAVSREAVVQTAEKYVARGKIEPAIREYRKLLAENPNDINTLNRVGDLYARIQRIDEAVDFFTQIAEQYTTEGFFVKAIAIYKKIIKLNPTRLEVYEKLAELYHKQGLVTEARTQYQVLADYYTKHENAASAIAIYQKMVELEPDNPSYHVRLAEIYQQQQLLEKAVGEYRTIAEMMIRHGRSQEAAQVYERALAIDSGNSGFIKDAATKLRDAGNAAAAVRFLAIAKERNPQAARMAWITGLEEEKPKAQPEPEPAPAPPPPPQVAPAPVARVAPPQQPVQPAAPPPPPAPEPEPEMEVELEAELIPGIDFPLKDWRTSPELFETSAPSEEVESQELSTFTGQFEEVSGVEVEPPVKAWASSSPPAAPPESDEIDLNLDEVFVLDLDEEEEEPSSLVKPPPDMLAGGKGQAWAQEPEELSPLTAWPEPAGSEAEEMSPALVEMDLDLAPLQGMEEVGTGALPSLEESSGIDLDEGLIELEIEEPEPPPAGGSPWVQIEDFSDLPQLDAPAWAIEPEVEAAAPALPAEPVSEVLEIDPDVLERTAAELHPQELARDEDLVSEAEVLAKYGLEDKALERLREALRLRPDNLGAYAQMIHIHLGKGDDARVIELAHQMSGIVARTGDRGEVWGKLRRQLVVTGYRFDGDRLVAAPGEPEVEVAVPAPFTPAPPPDAPRRRPAGPDVDQMLQGILREKPVRTPRTPAPKAPAAEPPRAVPPPAAAPAPAAAASAPSAPAVPARPAVFNPLEIGEMIEREMWSEEAEPSFAAPDSAAQPPARGLDDSGSLSWLDEADRGRDVPEPAKKAAGLFDEEDDFFDLAAELEEELTAEGVLQGGDLLVQPTEQSLEEIVEGFKKGVAEHLSPTDYDTHFNLGIAYR